MKVGDPVQHEQFKEWIGRVIGVKRQWPSWWSWTNWVFGPRPWQHCDMVEVHFLGDGLSISAPFEEWKVISPDEG